MVTIIPTCKECGRDLLNPLRRSYCSKECFDKGKYERYNEIRKEKIKLNKELHRCIYCEKDIDNTKYVICLECRMKHRVYSERSKKRNGKK
jgi:hypothetical protein